MVTLVSTDVEGSTELWEWDRDAMDAATKVTCVPHAWASSALTKWQLCVPAVCYAGEWITFDIGMRGAIPH